MKDKLEADKAKDLASTKMKLVELEKEIISRYFYQKGKTKMGLKRDKEVDEAIAILKRPGTTACWVKNNAAFHSCFALCRPSAFCMAWCFFFAICCTMQRS